MPSLIAGFNYDIFISYRQKDNKYDGWVTEFVSDLRKELAATIKEDVSVYFDENPHDGLLENHVVGESLREKLRVVIFIPIISQTYCDVKSFAWQHELVAFNKMSATEPLGKTIRLRNGNFAGRILPVQIHDLEPEDQQLIENEIGPLRAIQFVFKASGVNRPLLETDSVEKNLEGTSYRDQINKLANAIKDILYAVTKSGGTTQAQENPKATQQNRWLQFVLPAAGVVILVVAMALMQYFKSGTPEKKNPSVAILPFRNNTGSTDMDIYGIGLSAEIRTKLSMAKHFSFISSMQATIGYANTMKSAIDIGKELGVDYILTGIFHKSGRKMKVETELVDALSGNIIWSLPFEEEVDDLFILQADIANSVLRQLSSEHNVEPASITDDITAYAHFVKGNHSLESAFGDSAKFEDSYKPALEQFEKAIQLDSGFSEAWANLIGVECFLYQAEEDNPARKKKIERYYALFSQRKHDSLSIKMVESHYLFRVKHDYARALKLLLDVLKVDPENVHAVYAVSSLYRRKGDLHNSLWYAAKQVRINPSHAGNWANLAMVLSLVGDSQEAAKAAIKSWELSHSKNFGLEAIMLANEAGYSFDKLPVDLQQKFADEIASLKATFNRDYASVKRIYLRKREFHKLASTYFESGNADSAVICWLMKPENEKRRDSVSYFVYKGDKRAAIKFLERSKGKFADPFERLFKYEQLVNRLYAFSALEMYPEAHAELRSIVKEFPQIQSYKPLLRWPEFDKINARYPPFKILSDSLKATIVRAPAKET